MSRKKKRRGRAGQARGDVPPPGAPPRTEGQRDDARPDPGEPRGRGRRWLFWCAILAFPWLALLALELGLRLGGYGVSMDFVVRHEVDGEPRLLSNPHFTWRFFEPGAARLLPPFSLAVSKPPGTCRVFVLGGSAAQGDPEPGFGLARMLEVLLRDQYPGVAFEVANAAPTAVNSHVVYAMARAAVDLEPDALVVYSGNNEVVGPYGAGTVLTGEPPSLALLRAGVALRATRLGQLAGAVAGAVAGRGAATSESWRGMGMFLERQVRLSDPALERTYRDYERNLTDTCRAAARAGVPLVLSTVSVKLRDWGPFASLNATSLSAAERARFDALYADGARLQDAGDAPAAREALEAALEIDDTHAELLYRLGQAAESVERHDEARERLVEARDHDTLRFRADTRTNTIVREVAAREAPGGARLADVEARLAEEVALGVPGDETFLDHVHLTFLGNHLVAAAVFEELRQVLPGWVRERATGAPPPGPEECARRLVYTELDRYLIAETMHRRLQDPPFTDQLDHEAHLRRFAEEMEALRARGESGAVEAVLQEYERALAEEGVSWRVRERYATIEKRAGALDVAEREWRRLAREFPQYPSFELQLARTLSDAGRYAEAEAALQRVLDYREEPSTLLELAAVVARQGERERAAVLLDRILDLTVEGDPVRGRAREALETLGSD